jgi:glucan 1,3-beta-glucosidase
MTGVNIGGWMVLEPWITPSLFYRWLGKTKSEGVARDSWTFCEQLGPVEGNKVMRAHWDAWVTEEHIKKLAERDVDIVRLPIGDWTTTPYGPYVGCMDGAREKITWFLDTCAKYNIKVLLDVHALKDSQNGFDNSGKASDVYWSDEFHFTHMPHRYGHWQGSYNSLTLTYDIINWSNIIWGIDNVRNLMLMWGNHPAVYALEPVNEPWWNSDLPTLKTFYRQVRNTIREVNPNVKFVFHDAF